MLYFGADIYMELFLWDYSHYSLRYQELRDIQEREICSAYDTKMKRPLDRLHDYKQALVS